MKRIKIFLSDPQILFREGIHFILSGEDDFEVTGETTNNEDALTYIENNPPDIAILNTEDKKISGPEATRRIKRQFASVSAILTVETKEKEQLFEVIESGAAACLTKDTGPEQLLEIIRNVSQSGLPISEELLVPEIAAKVLTEFEDIKTVVEGPDDLMAGLSPKESQILSGIAAGNPVDQVAVKLNSDEKHIRDNLNSILNKLVVNDRTRTIVTAVQTSLTPVINIIGRSGNLPEKYLTREEFVRFKDNLAKLLKDVV